jgi:hypothetical protein
MGDEMLLVIVIQADSEKCFGKSNCSIVTKILLVV